MAGSSAPAPLWFTALDQGTLAADLARIAAARASISATPVVGTDPLGMTEIRAGDQGRPEWLIRFAPVISDPDDPDPVFDDLCELDRVEVASSVRRRGLATCLYAAFEVALRSANCPGLAAQGSAEGASFVARTGYDFEDGDRGDALRAIRNGLPVEARSVRYPFQVLDLQLPGIDGHRLLQSSAFGYIRRFDGWPQALEDEAARKRKSCGC
jgi:hypothetical protein